MGPRSGCIAAARRALPRALAVGGRNGLVRGSGVARDWPMPSSRGGGAGPGGLDGFRAVERWLAAQPLGDAAGFADGGPGGLRIIFGREVGGVVEQAVGEVVGVECWRRLAMADVKDAAAAGSPSTVARRARARSRSARCMAAAARAGSRRAGQQLGGGGGVGEVPCGAGASGRAHRKDCCLRPCARSAAEPEGLAGRRDALSGRGRGAGLSPGPVSRTSRPVKSTAGEVRFLASVRLADVVDLQVHRVLADLAASGQEPVDQLVAPSAGHDRRDHLTVAIVMDDPGACSIPRPRQG